MDKAKVAGKSIVVVDDLYQSGLTINYLAEELRLAGAREAFGLAAVKTLSNDDNLPDQPGRGTHRGMGCGQALSGYSNLLGFHL